MPSRVSFRLLFASACACSALAPIPAAAQTPGAVEAPPCETAPVGPGTRLIGIGIGKGETLTNVRLGGNPLDHAGLARIVIEPGTEPLSLVLRAVQDTVVEIGGETARVREAVVIGQAGVIGLPRSRLRFVANACGAAGWWDGNEFSLGRAAASVLAQTGRRPDLVEHRGTVGTLSVPSLTPPLSDWRATGEYRRLDVGAWDGTIRSGENGAQRIGDAVLPKVGTYTLRQDAAGGWWVRYVPPVPREPSAVLVSRWPGGYAPIDPGTIVVARDATIDEMPPQEAGLLHLEREGAIRRPTPREVEAWREAIGAPYRSSLTPDFKIGADIDFVVERPFRLPLMGGGVSIVWSFLLPAGMPEPEGNGGLGLGASACTPPIASRCEARFATTTCATPSPISNT